MNETERLLALSAADAIGGAGEVKELLKREAAQVASVADLPDGGITATIAGTSDYTVMLEAHYDQIGLLVTEILPGGFLRVAAVGGVDGRHLPATRVTVYGKAPIPGVITSVPPHLKKGDGDPAPTVESVFVDTGLSDAGEQVSVGDRVAFAEPPVLLAEGVVSGPSLDNRAGCAAVLGALERIKAAGKPPVTVVALFADAEELGMRGSRTSAYTLKPDEAVAVDVTFGDQPAVSPEKAGRLGNGGMIGLSPALDRGIADRLTAVAADHADCQFEIMASRTGTDADVITLTRGGIRTGLVSIPLRNMHTTAETVWMKDVEAVAELLAAYAMEGTDHE